MDLDARDRRLLCLLDRNARRPLSHLSKDLQISKQAATQRVLKLRRSGIISSPYALLNTLAMARVWGRLLIRLQMAGPRIEKEMLDFARKQKGISCALSASGAYDFIVIYWSESISEFKKSSDEFLYRFANYIKGHDISFITAGHDFSVRAFAPEVESVESVVRETGKQELDGKDRKVLAVLAEHAGMSALEIGKRTGIDPKTAYYRIKRLEEAGVILNYRLKINYQRLGYSWYKFFLTFSNPDARKVAGMFAYLRGIPELICITEAVGPADLEFEVVVPSANRMQEILVDLRNTFAGLIKDYKYMEIRDVSAIRYFPK